MTTDPRLENITAALTDLGPDYNTALGALRASGLRGEPGSAQHCIIAEYLRSRGCENCSVSPASGIVRLIDFNEDHLPIVGTVQLPLHLQYLASSFDGNMFPELEVRHDRP